VYSLVDLHQDGWSKYVGADGAPFWANQPVLPAADVDEHDGGQATTSAAVQTELEGFFADQGGLVEDYASMAGRLAARIDRQPGVIGLELINEPLSSPTGLNGFYAAVAPAVRAAAPGLPIYAEPDATRNVADFAHPPMVPADDVVYAPHLYTGVFQSNWTVGDDARIEQSIQGMVTEASEIHAPLVVTEYGNNPVDPTGAAWLDAALGLLDRHAVSASFWVYEEWPSTCGQPSCWGLYDEAPIAGATSYTRTLRPQAVALLARAYPQAIAGSLDSFAYDRASHVLTVQMHGAHGTHVLAAPRLIYPGDVTVTCDGAPVTATRTGGRVEVDCDGATMVMRPAE
jgi:endoglycosylceramidase